MNTIQKEIFDELKEIAGKLNDVRLNYILNGGVSFPDEGRKPNMTIVGQPGDALFEIAGKLLGAPPAVDCRRSGSFKAKLTYGDTPLFKAANMEVSAEKLTEMLDAAGKLETAIRTLEAESDVGYIDCEIAAYIPALKNIDVTLVCSSNEFFDFDWHALLSDADFCVMMLSALRPLVKCEREFIRDSAIPILGGERFGVCVSGFETLRGKGKDDVRETVEYNLRSDENIRKFYTSAEEGREYGDLIEFALNELAAKPDVYGALRDRQNILVCINEAKAAGRAGLEGNALEKIDEAIRKINTVAETLSLKKEATKYRIDSYITANVKIPLLDRTEDFNNALKSDIRSCLRKSDDFETMTKSVARFIEHSWQKFCEEEEEDASCRVMEEMTSISETIQSEVSEAIRYELGEDGEKILDAGIAGGFAGDMPRRKSTHLASKASKATFYTAAAVSLVFPLAGIAGIAASFAIKSIFKDAVGKSRVENFIKETSSQCDVLRKKMADGFESFFDKQIAERKEAAEKAYENVFADIYEALDKRKAAAKDECDKIAYINEVLEKEIPRLESKLTF